MERIEQYKGYQTLCGKGIESQSPGPRRIWDWDPYTPPRLPIYPKPPKGHPRSSLCSRNFFCLLKFQLDPVMATLLRFAVDVGGSQELVPFGGTHNEDYKILRSILGSPCLGKLPCLTCLMC